MSDYNWREARDFRLSMRFPEWATGVDEWERQASLPEMGSFEYKGEIPYPHEPRLFVSHKQSDANIALHVRRLAKKQGFDVWLDVLDPDLRSISGAPISEAQRARLIAGIIEVALLNCSHVIAIMTPSTRTSRWVPYEYGRVKDDNVLSTAAGAFLYSITVDKLPEYMQLGAICEDEPQLESWLEEQAKLWPTKYDEWLIGEVWSWLE